MPTDGRIFLISALQILEKENMPVCERAVEFLADKYGTPPIPFASYDPGKAMIGLLPAPVVRLRGIVPFAKLGKLTLVATLNPEDAKLKAEVEKSVGGDCRYYLADASAIEALLAKTFGETEAR